MQLVSGERVRRQRKKLANKLNWEKRSSAVGAGELPLPSDVHIPTVPPLFRPFHRLGHIYVDNLGLGSLARFRFI